MIKIQNLLLGLILFETCSVQAQPPAQTGTGGVSLPQIGIKCPTFRTTDFRAPIIRAATPPGGQGAIVLRAEAKDASGKLWQGISTIPYYVCTYSSIVLKSIHLSDYQDKTRVCAYDLELMIIDLNNPSPPPIDVTFQAVQAGS